MRRELAAIVVGLLAAAAPPGPAAGQEALQPVLAWDATLAGTGEFDLSWPLAVAAGRAGEIAVADAAGSRLVVFRLAVGAAGWKPEREVALPGSPLGLAHDGTRYLLSLREDGGLLAAEGEGLALRPLPLPEGVVPGALAAADGAVWLHDPAGGRILALDGRLDPVVEIPVDGYVTALAAAPGGGVLATLAEPPEVRRYGPDGQLLAGWPLPGLPPVPAWPGGVVVEPGGDVVISDRHNGRLLVLDGGGRPIGFGARRGWDPGLLRWPAGLARLPDGRLAVADLGNGRVQLYRRLASATAP